MPTLAASQIPLPSDWGEFEDIALSCFKIKWSSPNLSKHGRQGQPQNGVDIYGEDDLGRFVGIQCKLVNALSEKGMLDEIQKAENFLPALAAFYFATSLPSDQKLQKTLRLLSQDRFQQNKFPIGIFFWEDLMSDLTKNKAEFQRHYPEFNLHSSEEINLEDMVRPLLTLGFYGVQLKWYIEEIGFDNQSEFEKYFKFLESAIISSVDPTNRNKLLTLLTKFLLHFHKHFSLSIDGQKINTLEAHQAIYNADQFKSELLQLDKYLSGKRLAAFTCGRILGQFDQYEDLSKKIKVDKTTLQVLDSSIRNLLSVDSIPLEVEQLIKHLILELAESYEQKTKRDMKHNPISPKIYTELMKLVLLTEL